MKAAFADTSFFVAVHNRRDLYHSVAVALATAKDRPRIITTEFVLVEVANFFLNPRDRGQFVTMESQLRNDPTVEIVPASTALFIEGVELFAARPDKEWSLTDCISFSVMTARGLTDALTADQHFAQAGFRSVLAP
jgi:predicted nucleic acid-binding protein